MVINGKNNQKQLNFNEFKIKMSIVFFKWVQYLQRREITKLLELYSTNTILIPKIEPIEKPSLINP